MAKKQSWFKVLDSSRLPFYSAPRPFCKNFDGMVLKYVGYNNVTGQIILAQPDVGTVSLNPEHVEKIENPNELL